MTVWLMLVACLIPMATYTHPEYVILLLLHDNDVYAPTYIACTFITKTCFHVARMGEERGVYRVLVGKLEGRDHWGDLGVDGWILLGWISRRWDVGIWTGFGWPRIETGGGRL